MSVEVVSRHAGLVARRCSAPGRCSSTSSCSRRSCCSSLFSFNANKYGTFPFTGWTTALVRRRSSATTRSRTRSTTSLKVAVEVTIVSTIVGTAAAFPLVRSRLPFRSGVRIGMTLPIMIPGLLIGVSLLVLLTDVFHLQLSPQTAVIGQAVYTTPFVLLLVAARLQGFDPSLERAASDLGANTYRRLRHVVLPADRPGGLRRRAVRVHALARRVHHHAVPDRRAQHAADLHLHAGEVRDHARGERARLAAARRLADPDRVRVRAAARDEARAAPAHRLEAPLRTRLWMDYSTFVRGSRPRTRPSERHERPGDEPPPSGRRERRRYPQG